MENLDSKTQELLKKYQEGKCTAEEVALLEHLYNLSAGSSVPENLSDQDYNLVRDEIWSKLPFHTASHTTDHKVRRLTIVRRAAMVAAVFIGLFVVYFFSQNQHRKSQNYTSDIPPGGNKAVLTLADGKKIILGDAESGKIAEQTGIKIIQTAAGEIIYEATGTGVDTSVYKYNTIETPVGGKYQVRLPDGTKVWLNALSSITYPVTLNSVSERQLSLTGEAYFQVSPDKHRPFSIKTYNQQVVVLGTHFNINSYTDEQAIKTTLFEGRVKVINNDSGKEDFLKPGEQSVVRSNSTTINKADEEEALAWVNDKIIFNDEPLADIMRKVARWYNVEVTFRDGTEKITFMGAVSRNKKISSVLNYFKSTETVDFILRDNRIVVIKK
jgi:transmembrane sensor